jgi:hypothetical protein
MPLLHTSSGTITVQGINMATSHSSAVTSKCLKGKLKLCQHFISHFSSNLLVGWIVSDR